MDRNHAVRSCSCDVGSLDKEIKVISTLWAICHRNFGEVCKLLSSLGAVQKTENGGLGLSAADGVMGFRQRLVRLLSVSGFMETGKELLLEETE